LLGAVEFERLNKVHVDHDLPSIHCGARKSAIGWLIEPFTTSVAADGSRRCGASWFGEFAR
jgi:hypothetical protein